MDSESNSFHSSCFLIEVFMPESAHCFGNRLWANVVPTRSYHDAPSRQGGLEGNWCLIAVAVDSEEKIMTCVITILHVNKERVFDFI